MPTPEHISSSQSSTLEPTDTDDLVILESSPGRPGTSKVQHISKTPSGINRLSSFYFNGPPSGSISQPSDSLPSSPLNSEAQVGQATGRIKQMDISKSPKHTTKQGMRELVSKFRMKGAPEEESSSDSELDLPSRLVSGSKRKLARKRTVDALSSPERSMSKRATPDTVDVSSDSDDLPMRGSRRSRLQRGSRLTHTARSSSPDAQPSRKTLALVDLSDEDSDGMPGGTFTRQYETIEPHVMKLFNRGTKDELMEKTGATGDEAQAIIKLRPFEDMEAIEYSMRRTKGLRLSLFTQYRNSILGHAEVEAVIFQCSGVFAQLKQAMRKAGMLSNDKTGAVSLADNIQLEQPQMISKNYQLKHYQLEGVEWLNCLRNSNASGILADEMGLGKTFQGLEEGRVKGPSLVVCPSSTLDNWMNECAKFAPSLRAAERLALQSELQDEETYDLATGNKLDRMFLKKRQFHSMILDEGHMVKNCMSSRYKWLMQIRTPFRLLLTGTPLQNNLQELVSLLTFILPQVFAESQPMLTNAFKAKAPVKRSAGADSDDGTVASSMGDSGTQTPVQPSTHIEQAKTLLRPFVLRRRKCDVLNDLPSKTENIVNRKLYDSISTDAQVKSEDIRQKLMKLDPNKIDLTESAEKQATKLNGSSWISTFMNMRKVSDHPLLLRSRYDKPMLKQMAKLLMREPDYADANYEYVLEDMEICTTYPRMHKFKLPDEALQLKKIVDECISRGEKLLLFSQFTTMLNILEKVFALWKIEYFRLDGQTKVDERQGLIDEFNSKDNQVPVFLLSTKAGGFGINLTASNVVVIYDSGNNPSEERQAEDRAHRVGQVRDVRVYKLIGTNTIDEDILESSRSKQLVEHMLWF
ncbi:P-loop containing nucleoside triphosphate hydrolase protein [Coemansia mojavensis]|nr:P-loop containing nucleoside triphosphate hydrolase protein [Coemansia mojavensis]